LICLLCSLGLSAAVDSYIHFKGAALVSKTGATVARAEADAKGHVTFTGVKPGEYKVILTNAAGRSVTVGDLDGDGVLDVVIAAPTPPAAVALRELPSRPATGKASVSDLNVMKSAPASHEIKSPRDSASGLPTGKRMHKPMVFLVDWSGKVQGGLSSEAEATRAAQQQPPSGAGRCAVQIDADVSPGTIEIQSYSWGLSQAGTSASGESGRLASISLVHQDKTPRLSSPSQGKKFTRAALQSSTGAMVASLEVDAIGQIQFSEVPPGEYRLVLTNEDGRTVTMSDLDGDGKPDLVISGGGLSAGKVSVQDLSVMKGQAASGGTGGVQAPRDVATGQASGKRQHKPYACVVDWSGQVQGGFSSEAEARSVGKALPPSPAGRCVVQVSVDSEARKIVVRGGWDLATSKK
jgi:hypothetical protein